MSSIPSKLPWDLMNPRLAAAINPILVLPILNGTQLDGITLTANTPVALNHMLQRKQQGWWVVDQNASATIWRTQPFNVYTLTLEASANVTISLWVY